MFVLESNILKNGVLQQSKFLTETISKLDGDTPNEVLDKLEKLRNIVTDPSNVVLYLAGNLNLLKNASEPIINFLPPNITVKEKQKP